MDSGWFSTYPLNRYTKCTESIRSCALSLAPDLSRIFQFDMTRRNFYFINIHILLSLYIRSSNSVRRFIYVRSIFDCVKMLSKRQSGTDGGKKNRDLTGQHIRTCNKVPFDRSFNALKANINEFPFSCGI